MTVLSDLQAEQTSLENERATLLTDMQAAQKQQSYDSGDGQFMRGPLGAMVARLNWIDERLIVVKREINKIAGYGSTQNKVQFGRPV